MLHPCVGRAYRCPDGVIRWITHRNRGLFHVLWLDEESQVWYRGSAIRIDAWPGGEPYPAPGDTYRRANAFGGVEECLLPEEGWE